MPSAVDIPVAPTPRLQGVPQLINPIVAPVVPYPNELPYLTSTLHPDLMMQAARRGVEMGAMIQRLPREGQENIAQAHLAAIAKEQAANLQSQIKQIQSSKLDAAHKTAAIHDLILQSGMGYGPQGGTFDPRMWPLLQLQLYGTGGTMRGGANQLTPDQPPVGGSTPPPPPPPTEDVPKVGTPAAPTPQRKYPDSLTPDQPPDETVKPTAMAAPIASPGMAGPAPISFYG